MQVVADYRGQQRALRQQQAETREVERCMERMLSHLAAEEHALDYQVRVVSITAACFSLNTVVTDCMVSSQLCTLVQQACQMWYLL